MPTTWDDLVANVTARQPVHEGKEWVLVPESQSDEWERLVEQAIG
jgi:hypothetical protein